MKKLFTLLLLLTCASIANAQTVYSGRIYYDVDVLPKYPGGDDSLVSYIAKNCKYPAPAKDCGCSGTVYVTFIVETDGKVSDPEFIRKSPPCGQTYCYDKKGNLVDCYENLKKVASEKHGCDVSHFLDEEAIRVTSTLPNFTPGLLNDKPVRVKYNLPIKFSLR